MFTLEKYIIQYIDIVDLINIFLWLLEVIDDLHKKGDSHNDIQAKNIIIYEDIHKYELIGYNPRNDENVSIHSPEMSDGRVFENDKYFKTSDIYAIGLLLYKIITGGDEPYIRDENGKIKSKYRSIKSSMDIPMKAMLKINPDERVTAPIAIILLKNYIKKLK